MSEETKQETQEIENTEETGAEDTISATEDDNTATETQPETEDALEAAETAEIEEAQETVVEENLDNIEIEEVVKDEDSSADSSAEEQIEESEAEVPEAVIEASPPVEVANYLDPAILDVKVITEDDLDKYDEEEILSDKFHEQYSSTFSDIREKEVVSGTVVGLTDRDVLVDIGFKAEGIIHRTEFKELPEAGDKVDVYIITFEDRKGNIILSKERADFQKRWNEI